MFLFLCYASQSPNVQNKFLSSISPFSTYPSSYILDLVNGLTTSLTKSRIRVVSSPTLWNLEPLFSPSPGPPTANPSLSSVTLPLSAHSSPPFPVFPLKLPCDHTVIIFFLIVVYLLEFPAWSCFFILFSLLGIFFHHLPPNGEMKLPPKLSLSVSFSVKSRSFILYSQQNPLLLYLCSCCI